MSPSQEVPENAEGSGDTSSDRAPGVSVVIIVMLS